MQAGSYGNAAAALKIGVESLAGGIPGFGVDTPAPFANLDAPTRQQQKKVSANLSLFDGSILSRLGLPPPVGPGMIMWREESQERKCWRKYEWIKCREKQVFKNSMPFSRNFYWKKHFPLKF